MFDGFGFTVLSVCLKQVRHMQKTGSLETDIYESTLHTRKNPHYPPKKYIPYKPFSIMSLYQEVT